uniref:Endonuclease/exonuclease/phosphatase domain-containing protein n=1 Tax=Salarias fasciatus TaxID=181472 RepID=A0A672H3J0_SALFA
LICGESDPLTDSSGRRIVLIVEVNPVIFTLVNTYGCRDKKSNNTLFSETENKIGTWVTKYPAAKIIWGGDFNVVMNENVDRWPPRDRGQKELEHIWNHVDPVDIWRLKLPSDRANSWSNKNTSLQSG